MEENQTEVQENVQEVDRPQNPQTSVSFPTVGQSQKSSSGKSLLILGILALIGVLGYLIFRSAANKQAEPTPTPIVTSAPIVTPSPSASSKPFDRSKVKIEIQNGTGITGEAAFLQTQLKSLSYTTISVGNASSQNLVSTQATFSKNLASDVVDEITKKLKDIYKEVDVKTSSSTTSIDVVIVTGLRKGSTAKPSASATTKASATPTAKASSTASPSASPTASPL